MGRLTMAELAAGVALLRPKPRVPPTEDQRAASLEKGLATREANKEARIAEADAARAAAAVLADAERARAAEASAKRGKDEYTEALRRDLLAGRFNR